MSPEKPSKNSASDRIQGLVEHLFRRETGRLVSTLTRIFGPSHLDLAEDVVQEALIRALRHWSLTGTPDNPRAWLFQTARNLALDAVRRESCFREKEPEIRELTRANAPATSPSRDPDELADDQLRMIFTCCHPVIPEETRVALTLRTLGGFATEEIARAFLKPIPTIAQQLVRAKRKLREATIDFSFPAASERKARQGSVLEVLYLMFNEGYSASRGDDLVRHDLVDEAIRLTHLLAGHEETIDRRGADSISRSSGNRSLSCESDEPRKDRLDRDPRSTRPKRRSHRFTPRRAAMRMHTTGKELARTTTCKTWSERASIPAYSGRADAMNASMDGIHRSMVAFGPRTLAK